MSQSLWSGRFTSEVTLATQLYTASVSFDRRLASMDIKGSLAHAQMLFEVNLLSEPDWTAIQSGLAQIQHEIDTQEFDWRLESEDVHLNIERRLTTLIGQAGKRIHTARSRNDQVATDLRLWCREQIDVILQEINAFKIALLELATQHTQTIMPGFTHLQVAQPITFAHHLMAYFEMLHRDSQRFIDCRSRVNQLPLGAAALAGTGYPINRQRVAELLGFSDICQNSLDAVSDRDFAIEFCSNAAILMVHLSRFSEELILWMNPRFGFITIGDAFCTGSSIMPQKKNPDVPELARGKTGRVIGHLTALLVLMKGQPLAYNKDNQEDKEPIFDTADTLIQTLSIYSALIKEIVPNIPRMRAAAKEGFSTATDLADYLVTKGIPFRDAHEAVAQTVRYAEQQQCDLADLSLEELCQFSDKIDKDVYDYLTLEGSIARRNIVGGTAPDQVSLAIQNAYTRINPK